MGVWSTFKWEDKISLSLTFALSRALAISPMFTVVLSVKTTLTEFKKSIAKKIFHKRR